MTSVRKLRGHRTNIKAFRAPRLTVRRPRKRSINPTHVGASVFAQSSGGRNRTYGILVQGQVSLPAATTPDQPRVPCGNRTRLASLEGWSLCRSAKGTWIKAEREGVEPSRLLRSTAFEAAAIASWLALPLMESSGGRTRTSTRRLNRPLPYRLATPDQRSQDGWI